jgi:hypothetical protein
MIKVTIMKRVKTVKKEMTGMLTTVGVNPVDPSKVRIFQRRMTNNKKITSNTKVVKVKMSLTTTMMTSSLKIRMRKIDQEMLVLIKTNL